VVGGAVDVGGEVVGGLEVVGGAVVVGGLEVVGGAVVVAAGSPQLISSMLASINIDRTRKKNFFILHRLLNSNFEMFGYQQFFFLLTSCI